MKLGILGTGKIAQEVLSIMHELPVESLSILGRPSSGEKTERLACTYGISHCFYDYEEMLKSDIDTVYVALPNHLHYGFSKKALEAGKHVIVEKPAAVNYGEFRELREIAQRKEGILVEAMNIHYLPAFCAMKEEIGRLGALRIVSLNYSQYSSRYDAFRAGNVPPVFDPEKAGGALMDINVYNIHAAVGLFGRPQAVHYLANIQRGIDTSGILTLDYNSFKAVCIGAKDCGAAVWSSLQGERGSILIPSSVNRMRRYVWAGNHEKEEVRDYDDGRHHLYYEFLAFCQMIGQRDHVRAQQMLDISEAACRILDEARP